jgi:glycosyltransferase involved in cell wall biosynthesis
VVHKKKNYSSGIKSLFPSSDGYEEKMEKKIIFLAPIPPPLAGPEIINHTLLESDTLKNAPIVHIKSNIRRANAAKGTLDLSGTMNFVFRYFDFVRALISPQIYLLYFMLSSSKIGFIRDSFYILTASILNKKIVGHYHGSNFDGFYRNQSKILKKYIKFTMQRLDRLILSGNCIKPIFGRIYPLNKLEVLYNGLDLAQYLPDKTILRKPVNVFTILFMGHIWFPKGFYDLILAYKKLHKKYLSNVRLIFAGENMSDELGAVEFLNDKWREKFLSERDNIANCINKFIINSEQYNAHYLGLVCGERKKMIFQQANVFILPSYTEGLSFACLEAMTMGLPVIVTPVGAMPEVVKHRENGLITPIGDHEKLAENIELLMKDIELRKRIERNNILFTKNELDVEVIAKKLLKIFKNI